MGGRTVTIDCPRCEGSGFIPDPDCDDFLETECPACLGEGWLDAEFEDYE